MYSAVTRRSTAGMRAAGLMTLTLILYIDAPESLERFLDGVVGRCALGDVALDVADGGAGRRDHFGGFLQALERAADKDDACPLLGHGSGDPLPIP